MEPPRLRRPARTVHFLATTARSTTPDRAAISAGAVLFARNRPLYHAGRLCGYFGERLVAERLCLRAQQPAELFGPGRACDHKDGQKGPSTTKYVPTPPNPPKPIRRPARQKRTPSVPRAKAEQHEKSTVKNTPSYTAGFTAHPGAERRRGRRFEPCAAIGGAEGGQNAGAGPELYHKSHQRKNPGAGAPGRPGGRGEGLYCQTRMR